MEQMIDVIICEPSKEAYVKTIKNDLETMQEIVGGYIECVYIGDGLLLICDEEGKLKGYRPNRFVNDDIICGTFFICREDGEDFGSLTDSDIENMIEEMN